MTRTIASILSVVAILTIASADVSLFDCENLDGWSINADRKYMKAEETDLITLIPEAHQGEAAIQVTMPGQATGVVQLNYPPADWDSFGGVSFWAKGDGSDQWGCLALMGNGSNRSYSYCYFFPLSSTEWTQYTVPWRDWIPEGTQDPIGAPGALPPSGIQIIRIGTRWTITYNNAAIPSHTYAIDDIQLVDALAAAPPVPAPRPLSEVLDLFRNRRPVHIICMGDSITAGTGLRDRDNERYATILQAKLREKFGYEEITAESRAVGGAKLTDARAWVKRDFQGEAPDLITTLYGYNDKSGQWSAAQYGEGLEDYLDRLAAVTNGQSALMPLITVPGAGPRYTMLDDFAGTVRNVAAKRGLTACDLQTTFKDLGREGMLAVMGDMAHPNADGHVLMAETIASFLYSSAQTD